MVKLDLGCGPNKREGFIGVDILPFDGKVDVVHDLATPWPWEDASVEEVHCSHTLEHFTQAQRCFIARELHRVLKSGGKATFITPDWKNERAYGDPTHVWPAVAPMSYFYWNKGWRDANAPHTEALLEGVDFDFTYFWSISEEWATRNPEMQQFALRNYTNSGVDLWATVIKKSA